MNNFDTQDKIDGIDKAIESVLIERNIDWKNETLHSWGYTTGLDALDVISVYGKDGVVFKNVNIKTVADNISVKFVDLKTVPFKKPQFILELTTILYKNTASYNIVVSNIAPDAEKFKGYEFHSEVGKWYTGLQ